MEKVNFKKDKIPFTQVANEVLYDKNLSAKAKGLYAYLYAKPDGWDFAIDRIAQEFSDGRKSINNGLKDLEMNGYLIRKRTSSGRVLYVLKSQMTQTNMGQLEPNAQNGKVPKRQSAETGIVSNTDKKEIKSLINKERETLSEFNNVKLDQTEIEKLHNRFGIEQTQQLVENLGRYMASKGKQYKSHYATLLNWGDRDKKKINYRQRSMQYIDGTN